MAGMPEDWQSQSFRSKIVSKLDDVMRNSQTQITKSSVEMEEYVFQKARTREEYLDLVARVLLSVTDHNKDKKVPGMVAPNLGQGGMVGNMRPQGAGPGQDQDPINALQNLAGQGTSGMGRQQSGGMMGGMHPMAGGPNQQQQQQQRMMDTQMMMRQPHMQHPRGPMPQRPPQLQRQDAFMVTSPQTMPGTQGQPLPASGTGQMAYQGQGGPIRSMGHVNMPGQYMPGRDVMPGMPIQSPAQGSPLAMMPSPHSQHGMMASPAVRAQMGAPSPSTMLHTPGTAVSDPSPGPPSTSQEELEYVKKLQKLSRYIEPLRKFVQDSEKKTDEDSKKNHKKMKSLLDILSDPSKRVPMYVLEKCEQVLLKLTTNSTSSSSHGHMCQPILDAVAHFSTSPSLNHSLYRTFGPAVEAYMGPSINAPSPPPAKKRKSDTENQDELPDIVQGEIARLGRRFIVSVDPRHHTGSVAHHLVCKLEEQQLPSVPPLLVTIPNNYPRSSPQCEPGSCPGYDATEFFQNVEKNLTVHLSNMPNRFCLTQLLSSWEMSVRKACDPTNPLITQPNPIFV